MRTRTATQVEAEIDALRARIRRLRLERRVAALTVAEAKLLQLATADEQIEEDQLRESDEHAGQDSTAEQADGENRN